MTITANGREREVAAGTTLAELIASFGWAPAQVVVERNGEPVPRGDMATITLQAHDRLEIVRAVAGG